MGTRGLYGFRKGNIDKTTYNHWDSYYSGLGKAFIKFLKVVTPEELSNFYDRIELKKAKSEPTVEEIEICKKAGYYNNKVSDNSEKDWYCLLHNLQSNFKEYKILVDYPKRPVYMIDNHGFIKDSLFCEYAYIYDIDKEVLEVYLGYQTKPQVGNRYGTEVDNGYYPCALIVEIPYKKVKRYDINFLIEMMLFHTTDEEVIDVIEEIMKEKGIDFHEISTLIEDLDLMEDGIKPEEFKEKIEKYL